MSERAQTRRGGDGARDRARCRETGRSQRVSHQHHLTRSSPGDLQDINRQTDGWGFDRAAELRLKINQLEQEKLELSSKYNQELSSSEAQLTRCRALLEKGEAQRQTLEYELAVVKRDAAAQKSRVEDKIADLITHNQQLEGLSAELHQRASDLQRALEITQQARVNEEQSLHAELRERDHLIHSISTEKVLLQEENRHLDTLLQEQKDTLQELKSRMDRMESDRKHDAEALRVKRAELRNSLEREEMKKMELKTAVERVNSLEERVESEIAAQLELKLRLRDVEAMLTVEERNRAEAASSLELIKRRYTQLETTNTRERERAEHTLALVEQEHHNTKTDLIGQLDHEKAESAKLIGQLDHEKAESAKLIGQLDHEKAESAKLIGQLDHEKAESAKLIGQLDHEKAESAKLIGQLDHEKAESAKLIGQLDHEKVESAKLSIRLQKQEGVETERAQHLYLVQKRLAFVEEAHDILLIEIEQLLHHYHHQGAPPINSTGDKLSSSALMDVLRRVVHHYYTELKDLVKVVDTLNRETKDKDEHIADQRRDIQEYEARCVCVSEEAAHLRVCVEDAADTAERAQTELQSVTHLWQQEREQHTHTKTHMYTLAQEHQREQQDLSSRLDQAVERLDVSERTHSALQQEVGALQQLVCVCRRDKASLLAACAMLAGCVCALNGRVCALVRQKALLQRSVCEAESLQQEVRALLSALMDCGVKGQPEVRGYVWKFRVCVIGVMAALRLRTLCKNTHTLFRVRDGVCVSALKLSDTHTEEEQHHKVMKMLTSSQLCVTLHTCMQELHTELQRTERSVCVLAAARSSFSKLMEKLLCECDAGCYGDVGTLTQRLEHGLHNLQRTHPLPPTHSNRVMISALQQHFLMFTQRLHSAEVERRDLRMELSRLKRSNTHTDAKACVPVQQFRSVCQELRSALRREQAAQTLLHEQARQLQELGVTMDTHTSEQLEKDHTLAQAVQSLSDVKAELKRKEQSLRLFGKQLSQSQREKRELQHSVNRAEHTLHMAARSKQCLLSYMLSVECSVRQLKDSLLSHSTSPRDDVFLHLPTMQQDTPELSAEDVEVCQALVSSFTAVYELAWRKMA